MTEELLGQRREPRPRARPGRTSRGAGGELREQLAAVERAEQRLAAGTYGLSIESGAPIRDERREAVPTAELTVAEERARAGP
jgi:RNA polymerase-binding transcription factor DksA